MYRTLPQSMAIYPLSVTYPSKGFDWLAVRRG